MTHGSSINISGKYFNFIPYGVSKETGTIDYDNLESLAIKHKTKMIVAGASAYPRIINFQHFKEIADKVGALFMVDMAHIAGLVVAGIHPSPVPYADFVTMTTHKTLRGPCGGMILCRERFATAIDKAVFPGIQGGPLMHVIAAKAVALKEAASLEFLEYQKNTVDNAKTLANSLLKHGFDLTSGGTDNHLMLVDLRTKKITGKEAEYLLDEIGITVNKNSVPFDTESPFVTSGIRLGTAAVTSRGFKQTTMVEVAAVINLVLTKSDSKNEAKEIVHKLCARFPLYE